MFIDVVGTFFGTVTYVFVDIFSNCYKTVKISK